MLRAAYVTLAAVDAALAGSADPRRHRLRVLTKPALLPLLALGGTATPAEGGPESRAHTRGALAAAQTASWVGDVALLAPGDRALPRGMSAFGTAHAAYASRLVRAARPGATRALAPVAAALAVQAVGAGVAARRRSPRLGVPTTAYGLALSTTAVTALAADGPPRARLLLRSGALAFLVSDAILAVREHVWRDSPPALEAAVMVTYTGAQLLLAEGFVRLDA